MTDPMAEESVVAAQPTAALDSASDAAADTVVGWDGKTYLTIPETASDNVWTTSKSKRPQYQGTDCGYCVLIGDCEFAEGEPCCGAGEDCLGPLCSPCITQCITPEGCCGLGCGAGCCGGGCCVLSGTGCCGVGCGPDCNSDCSLCKTACSIGFKCCNACTTCCSFCTNCTLQCTAACRKISNICMALMTCPATCCFKIFGKCLMCPGKCCESMGICKCLASPCNSACPKLKCDLILGSCVQCKCCGSDGCCTLACLGLDLTLGCGLCFPSDKVKKGNAAKLGCAKAVYFPASFCCCTIPCWCCGPEELLTVEGAFIPKNLD